VQTGATCRTLVTLSVGGVRRSGAVPVAAAPDPVGPACPVAPAVADPVPSLDFVLSSVPLTSTMLFRYFCSPDSLPSSLKLVRSGPASVAVSAEDAAAADPARFGAVAAFTFVSVNPPAAASLARLASADAPDVPVAADESTLRRQPMTVSCALEVGGCVGACRPADAVDCAPASTRKAAERMTLITIARFMRTSSTPDIAHGGPVQRIFQGAVTLEAICTDGLAPAKSFGTDRASIDAEEKGETCGLTSSR
jgi:hypothetical protein